VEDSGLSMPVVTDENVRTESGMNNGSVEWTFRGGTHTIQRPDEQVQNKRATSITMGLPTLLLRLIWLG